MDKKVLIRLLQHRVKELEAVLKSIDASEQVHEIELDLLLSKIRMIYDDVKLLSQSKQSEEKSIGMVADPVSAPTEEPEPEPEPILEHIEEPEPEPEPVPEHIEEPEPEPEPEPIPEHIEEPEPELKPDKPSAPEPMKSQEVDSMLKTALLKEPKEKILTNTKMQGVDDIMVAIGLNDRFLFTRELFNNDFDLFKNTIETLNQKGSWEEAGDYLEGKFSWDTEDPTLILFLSFVKRRFI